MRIRRFERSVSQGFYVEIYHEENTMNCLDEEKSWLANHGPHVRALALSCLVFGKRVISKMLKQRKRKKG